MNLDLKILVATGVILGSLAAVGIAHSQESTNEPEGAKDPMVRSVEIGTLTCKVLPDTRRNYVVRSTAEIDCTFKSRKERVEHYKGLTGIQLGLDLSVKEGGTLRFGVLSSREKGKPYVPYSLAGKYFGVSASASVTYGVGASALVGGTGKKISLQPLGIETLRGIGLNAGLGFLYLEPVKT